MAPASGLPARNCRKRRRWVCRMFFSLGTKTHCRSGAVLDTEFLVEVLQVLLHRARARAEDGADLGVALARGKPAQDLRLARRQPVQPPGFLIDPRQVGAQ